MRTVVNNSEVPHLWAHQAQPSARNATGSLYFEGKTIYSYGSHFPIATWVENAAGQTAVLVTTRNYSVTTTQHCSSVSCAIPRDVKQFHVQLNSDYYRQDKQHWVADYRSRIDLAQRKVAGKRSENTKAWAYERLESLVAEANSYCEFFGFPERFEVLGDFSDLTDVLNKERAAQAAETRKRIKAIQEENAEKIRAWIAGANVTLPHNLSDTYLRIESDEVVTSRGARFPVSHAVRGLRFVESIRECQQPYKHNGHTFHLGHYAIDAVDVQGNVTAGCHYVTWKEIERIAPQLRAR